MTADLRTTLLDLIGTGIAAHPRSLQRTVGPSDIANQCDVCLLRALAGAKGQRPGDDGWLPTIGTAVHSWLEEVVRTHGRHDYLAEQRVLVGSVGVHPVIHKFGPKSDPDPDVAGTLDVYHLPLRAVVDWKVVGDSTLKAARTKTAHEIGGRKRNYAVQVQQYGAGLARVGLVPSTVAIMYLPRNGPLRNAVLHEEPYNPDVADLALDRAGRLLTVFRASGLDVALSSVQADPHCYQCSTTGPRAAHDLSGAVLDERPATYPADLSSAVL